MIPAVPPGTAELLHDRLWPKPDPFEGRPVDRAVAQLNIHLWSKQRQILQSVFDHRYTAVHACHDSGKSYCMAAAAAAWITRHPVGQAFVVSTAPTWKQVKAILWREIRAMQKRAGLDGRINLDCEWYRDGELVAFGRKPADTDQAAFQGIHALYVLVVIDEAVGVPKSLFEAADTLATNDNARVVCIGNPDDPSSYFETVCRPGSGWNVIHIDGLETPNFTEERVKPYPKLYRYMMENQIPFNTEPIPDWIRPYLLSPQWVEERFNRWGVTSPIFTSKVRGVFPRISVNSLFPPAMLRAACERQLPGIGRGRYSFDVARFGDNETVGYRNRDGVIRRVLSLHSSSITENAGQIAAILNQHNNKSVEAVIDGVGLGAGVVDILVDDGYSIVEFNGGSAPFDRKQFHDRRSEIYWNLRQLFEEGLIDLDEDDEDLLAQLGSLRYRYLPGGRIRVESKDEMAKRGFPSPDRADAVSMSILEENTWNMFERSAHQRTSSLTGDLIDRPL